MVQSRTKEGTVWVELGYGDKWGDLCRAWAWAEVGSAEEQLRRRETFRVGILHSPLYEHWTNLMLTGAPLTALDVKRVDSCELEKERRFAHEYEDDWTEFQEARQTTRDSMLGVRRRTRRAHAAS